jgi:hypothetical protein
MYTLYRMTLRRKAEGHFGVLEYVENRR